MSMNKKYMMIGIPMIAIMGITAGMCIYKKTKKYKLDINCLSSI